MHVCRAVCRLDFSKKLARLLICRASRQYGFDGWAVLEWECCLKHPEQGAAEGARFIADHIIRVTEKAFDDFAGTGTDLAANKAILGLA